jgi:hypothetical protein
VLYAPRHPEFISGPRSRRIVFLLRGTGLRRHDDRQKQSVLVIRHAGAGGYHRDLEII